MRPLGKTIGNYRILNQIYESPSSLIYRAVRQPDHKPLVLKVLKQTDPSKPEWNRYKHEYEILCKLGDVKNVIRAHGLEPHQKTLVLVLEDFGGESLKSSMALRLAAGRGLLPLNDFLDLAIQLAQGVADVHSKKVIHKSINPTNILFNRATRQLKLIDFGISSVLGCEYPSPPHPDSLEGSLPYISPEQTGRMNRAVDYRADLYSLGATLCEILTGRPPFEGDDPLALAHAHLAKVPRPAMDLNPRVPRIVSDMIMRLLAKNAEDRYQSAYGLKADLERCRTALARLQDDLAEFSFELGSDDFSGQFHLAQKLHGGTAHPTGAKVAQPLPARVETTQNLEAEQALRESAEQFNRILRQSAENYRDLYDEAPIGYTLYDEEGRITRVNRRFLEILGYTAGEMLDRPVWDFVVEREAARELIKAKLAGIEPPSKGLERAYRRKDGTVVPVLIEDKIVRDGEGRITGVRSTIHDITERKKAEEALRESAEQYRLITTTSMAGFHILDETGRLLDVNDAFCRMLGYSREELLRMSVPDFEAAESPEETRRHLKRIAESGSDRFESRLRGKDGRIIDVEISATYMPQYRRQLTFLQDVTERKRAYEELRKAIMVLENSPAVLFRLSADRGFPAEFVSRNVSQFGYTPEELLSGKVPFISMIHPEDRTWLGSEVRKHDKRGDVHFQMEYRLVTKEGKSRWVDDRTMIVRDAHGRAIYHEGIILDITERKLAEEALEKRVVALTQPLDSAENIAFEHLFNVSDMQRLQDLFAQACGVAALITNPDGTPITRPSNFSLFCEEIIRKTPKGVQNCMHSHAMIGKHHLDGPDIQLCLSAGLWNAGATITVGGRHIANFLIGQVRNEAQDEEKIMEYGRQIGADEEPYRAAYRKVPVMPQEQFERVAHVLFAITTQLSTSAYQNVQQARFIADRRRAEVELSRHRDHLEELVRDRTKELEAAQEQLVKRERLSVLGQLTATVSHELRNPLGVIRSSAFYLHERIKDGDQKIQKHLDRIETQVDICDEIVGELLEYTRGSSSEMIEGEITPWLEKQLAEARGTVGIRVTCVFSNDLPKVFFDAGKMSRVITNLLDNAVHAVRDMTRKAEEEKREYEPNIRIGAARAEGGVVIQVEDNGIGMDEETVGRASEPLFTTKARGTGLGLSIVKKIVEEHGGTMNLESELHRGTKVTLCMPVREAPLYKNGSGIRKDGELMKGSLLLVDDNSDFLDSTKDVLEDAGYLVMTAGNGEEALSLFLDHAFDVVLMDIKMPGLNGVETFLRMKEQDPRVKVVLCTAYSVKDLIQKARQEGVCDILNKPLNLSKLLRLIEDIQRRKHGGYILIVDDDRGLCDSLQDGLEQEGFKVATAFEGTEAVKKAETEPFDILLLDMKLPGTNGLEVYRRVKKAQPLIITILITGYSREYSDLIRQAMSESAYTCVNKPMNMKRLLGLLEDVLASKTKGGAAKPQREG
ncbi:MAG: hypothetical protein CVU64_18265 [Deltaproteobacteria bacterium HGW-Deltaproteobacteria-21]|nr:MAG: hypothetical protein CVU64_18265 [Deltaproteobacteria bacterium HGW-Deltaproteobacteria-21]